MAKNTYWSQEISRRGFVKSVGAAGVVLSGVTMWPGRTFADDFAAMYASAKIDWKQASGGGLAARASEVSQPL